MPVGEALSYRGPITPGDVASWLSPGVLQDGGVPVGGVSIGGTVVGGTTGSVLFVGAGGALTQNNPYFFWDNTNHALFVGGSVPGAYYAYNTFTSSTNFERAIFSWNATANTLVIGTEKGSGGGTARDVQFRVGGTDIAYFLAVNTGSAFAGDLLWTTDNNNNIGSIGAHRPADIYIANGVHVGGSGTGNSFVDANGRFTSNGSVAGNQSYFNLNNNGANYGSLGNVSANLWYLGSSANGAAASTIALEWDVNNNVVVGIAALATNATNGFLYIPTSAGTPTGVPTLYTGRVAIEYDTTNNKFFSYNNSWFGFSVRNSALFDHFVDSGNSTTTETDLYSDTFAAGQFSINGDKADSYYGGTFVSSGTATRELRIYFGGTLIFDSGALTLSLSSQWTVYVELIRVSSTVIRYMVSMTTEGAALSAYTSAGEVTGLTLANTNILKITGQAAGVGAATNDIVAKLGSVKFVAAA